MTYGRNIIAGCVLFSLLCIAQFASAQDERQIDRPGWGQGPTIAWARLTPFESDVINRWQNRQRAVAADDLLALYLLASGDVRDQSRFAALRNQVARFVTDNQSLRAISDPRRRGASLLHQMHTAFLPGGYEADQSTLTELLTTGIYNCISSALLYLVLAAHFDLPASGVIMPSHAFVQLTLAGDEVIEVETTSPDGFGVVRDPDFFAEEAQAWFTERRLVVPTYTDYEQRRVVSATALGYENMWSQHVSEARMPYADRVRMAEIKGILQADNIEAQHNRLIYYYREADFLQRHDERLYHALMTRIEPYLARWEGAALAGLPPGHSAETLVALLLLQANRARWLVRHNNVQGGQALARDIIVSAPASLQNIAVIRDTAFQAIATTMQWYQDQRQFDRSADALAGLETQCAESALCLGAIEQHYGAHGQHYWDQRDWHRVTSIYHEFLALDLDTANTPIFRSNLEAAYINNFRQHWFDEERDEAVALLEVCLIRLPEAEACRDRLRESRQVHP